MTVRAVSCCVLVAALAFSSPARADDQAASTELFNAGRDLMKRGDYAAACPKLAESVRLQASVGALAKLATCEEHEKRLVSARARWQQALNLARSVGDARADEVATELARIDRIVPKLVIGATGALPIDVVLRVDDLQVGAASLGVALAVEPGRHTVSATASKKKSWSTTVDTKADGLTTSVPIPDLEDAPPDAAPPSPPPAVVPPVASPAAPLTPDARALAPTGSGDKMRSVGIVTAGAGAVALAVGAFFGVEAARKRADAGCNGTTCPTDDSARTLHDAKSAATTSTILFVVGGALAATGVTLWLVAPSAHTAQTARIQAVPTVGGVVVRASW